jgi:hypothetical protein
MKERLRRLEGAIRKQDPRCEVCKGPCLALPREQLDRLEWRGEDVVCPGCGRAVRLKVYLREMWELV